MDQADIIDELLEKTPFSWLPIDDQIRIVRKGRPQPPLPELESEQKEKNRVYTRSFNCNNYKKYHWLTGSSKSQKLYCWPCLLFSTDRGPWNKAGFNSLNYLVTACEKHQKSISHIRAFSLLQTFVSQRIDYVLDAQRKIADSKHNEKVKENRNVLKRLIDVVAFLGKQECAFTTAHDESVESKNKGMYRELLELLAKYDPIIDNHLKNTNMFNGTSPAIQIDLIDVIANEITEKIKSEISNATFVALSLDETTDVTNKSQLATIIRFVDSEGSCQERFLNFADVSNDRTAEGLMKHVIKIIDELNCSKKLIAQTFDGAAVMADHVSRLQSLVKEKYPSATFIHCYSHTLNLILSKSTNSIIECKRFFNFLSGISSFFSHSTARTNALKGFMERKLPEVTPTRWNFSSRLISTVGEYRDHLIQFFLSIDDESDNWTGEEVSTALGFYYFLSKVDTKFLIIIFKKIFSFSDVLFDTLQNKCMDISYCIEKVNKFYITLQKIKDDDFEHMWKKANEDFNNGFEPRSKRIKIDEDSSLKYHRLFDEILDTLMTNIKLRFDFQKDIKFVSLLDANNFHMYRKNFPQNLLAELKEPYASNFDILRLKNELSVIYSSDEYNMKTLHEFTHYMKLNKLDVVFTEVYKLSELILTFPSTTASVERSFSALKRIQTYLRATQGQVRLSNLALLSIEKDILIDMQRCSPEKFYENVTLKFTEKEKRMEFMLK